MAVESSLMSKLEKSILKKADLYDRNYWAYALRSMFASFYLALGTTLSMYSADKLNHVAEGMGKFSYGFLFGWGLLMILYMNAELGTSNMMYMTVAMYRKILPSKKAMKMLATCVLFNFVGAVLIAFLLSQTVPYSLGHIDETSYLVESTVAKLAKSPWIQFVEGIFANVVVNIAVFAFLKLKDDAGKILAAIFIIFIFAFFGFEHVIANFSTFSLSIFATGGPVEGMTLFSILSNFLFAGLGNFVGGGLVMGLLYSWLNEQSELYVD